MSPEQWRNAIGARFKKLRAAKPYRYNRRDFVAAFQRVQQITISESQIEKIENGKSFPGFEVILAYREFFDTNFSFLLAEEKLKKPAVPDLALYPEIRQYLSVMHEAGFSEEEAVRFVRDAARNLTELVLSSRPELKSPPLKKSKPAKKRPRK